MIKNIKLSCLFIGLSLFSGNALSSTIEPVTRYVFCAKIPGFNHDNYRDSYYWADDIRTFVWRGTNKGAFSLNDLVILKELHKNYYPNNPIQVNSDDEASTDLITKTEAVSLTKFLNNYEPFIVSEIAYDYMKSSCATGHVAQIAKNSFSKNVRVVVLYKNGDMEILSGYEGYGTSREWVEALPSEKFNLSRIVNAFLK